MIVEVRSSILYARETEALLTGCRGRSGLRGGHQVTSVCGYSWGIALCWLLVTTFQERARSWHAKEERSAVCINPRCNWVGDIQDQNKFFLLCSSHSPACQYCSFVLTPGLQHLWERQQSWENKCINPVPQTNIDRGTGVECMSALPQNTSLWAGRATSLTPSVRLAVAECCPTGKCLSQQSVVSCAVFLSSTLWSHQVAQSYTISQSSSGEENSAFNPPQNCWAMTWDQDCCTNVRFCMWQCASLTEFLG